MNDTSIRILIVEDSGYMTDSLRGLVGILPTMIIVGQATSRSEAVHQATTMHPALVILDLRIKDTPDGMPNADYGLDTLRELQRLNPSPKVLVLSSMPEQPWLRLVAQAGAVGFVSKDGSSAEIVTALRAICAGLVAFTPTQLRILQEPAMSVSPREYEVLRLLAEGLSDEEISQRLNISVRTVRKHVEHLRAIFGVHNRGQVVAAARRERLLPSEI